MCVVHFHLLLVALAATALHVRATVCEAVVSVSSQEGKEGMDDRLLDLIVECQGRRMDDQRSTAVPPVVVEAPKVLTTERPSVVAAEEGDRPQMDRPRQLVQVDDGRRRLSNESLGSLDDLFFDTLMSAQVSVCAVRACVCVWYTLGPHKATANVRTGCTSAPCHICVDQCTVTQIRLLGGQWSGSSWWLSGVLCASLTMISIPKVYLFSCETNFRYFRV